MMYRRNGWIVSWFERGIVGEETERGGTFKLKKNCNNIAKFFLVIPVLIKHDLQSCIFGDWTYYNRMIVNISIVYTRRDK